jgi:hypothetical protein
MKNSIKILALFLFILFCFSPCSQAALKPDFPDNSKLQKMPDGINADISRNIDSSEGGDSASEESNSNYENSRDRIQQKNTDNINYSQQEGKADYHFNEYTVFFVISAFFLMIFAFFAMREKKN